MKVACSVDEDFHSWLRRRRLVTESTIASYESDLCRLERYAGVPRDELTLTHVEAFLRNGYAPATKQRTFVAFRVRHRWGAAAGKWPLDAEINEIRLRRQRGRVRPALSGEQARTLLAHATTPVQLRTFWLGLYSGLRLGSLVAVDGDNWVGGIITVPPIKSYWDVLELPAHPKLATVRDQIVSESPGRRAIQRACIRMRRAIGVPVSPQWLRRTFSQRLRAIGIEPSVRAALMGHAPPSVADEFYSPPIWDELVGAFDGFDY